MIFIIFIFFIIPRAYSDLASGPYSQIIPTNNLNDEKLKCIVPIQSSIWKNMNELLQVIKKWSNDTSGPGNAPRTLGTVLFESTAPNVPSHVSDSDNATRIC